MQKGPRLNSLDRLYLARTYELARRGLGNTSPNPMVGAVVVADGKVVGEGYHHRAGEPHAEVHALNQAGEAARGATLYVSLEPCNHFGRTGPCSHAVVAAGVARVVIGTYDPNPKTAEGGIKYIQANGIDVEVADEEEARAIVEPFARAIRAKRPFVALKMAMSLDGFIASRSGVQQWLTGPEAGTFVRDLRIAYDAVMVGAGTVRIDDPQLTVRPAHHRLRNYVRVVACETDAFQPTAAVLQPQEHYAKTIVLAPHGIAQRFENLKAKADVVFPGAQQSVQLNLPDAMRALHERGITSVLCEGGPTLAGHLLAERLVDRVYWLVTPRFLRTDEAVPVLASGDVERAVRGIYVDRVERLGQDMLISGTVETHV